MAVCQQLGIRDHEVQRCSSLEANRNYPSFVHILQGDRQLALKNSERTYKHEILKEMRENGELDTQIYDKIKAQKQLIKKNEAEPRPFPARHEDIKYPEHALKVGNPLYQTSNMQYGAKKPSQTEMPTKFYPRPEKFTNTFLGGQFVNQGLNTSATPSRVHATHDK